MRKQIENELIPYICLYNYWLSFCQHWTSARRRMCTNRCTRSSNTFNNHLIFSIKKRRRRRRKIFVLRNKIKLTKKKNKLTNPSSCSISRADGLESHGAKQRLINEPTQLSAFSIKQNERICQKTKILLVEHNFKN